MCPPPGRRLTDNIMCGLPLVYVTILVKIIVALVVRTFYVPDEYWQSLEVAHHQAFGYGYLTWEWNFKIRSYIYPYLISKLYILLGILRLDYPSFLIYSPKIFQAVLSGYAEYRFFIWTRCRTSLLLLMMNPFWNYCATRTLINTVETSLTMIALSKFPWKNEEHRGSKFLWLVGFMFFMRPTSAIMWAPLCLYHICTSNKSITQLIRDYLTIGLSTAAIAIAIDSLCYGELVLTPWEFFKVNVLTNVANHYGRQRTLWYIYSALTVFLSVKIIVLPLTVRQILNNSPIHSKEFISVAVIMWTTLVYSMLPHKEHRFILPLLPLLIFIITSIDYPTFITQRFRKALLIIFIIINTAMIVYAGVVHQKGSIKIMEHLREEISQSPPDVSVMFLTPCHSTPFYSYVHQNISMEFLTCEPNLKNQKNYFDEADIFFNNPMRWLDKRYANSTLPSLVVMYDSLIPRIANFLNANYEHRIKVFDSLTPTPNRHQYISLFKLK